MRAFQFLVSSFFHRASWFELPLLSLYDIDIKLIANYSLTVYQTLSEPMSRSPTQSTRRVLPRRRRKLRYPLRRDTTPFSLIHIQISRLPSFTATWGRRRRLLRPQRTSPQAQRLHNMANHTTPARTGRARPIPTERAEDIRDHRPRDWQAVPEHTTERSVPREAR